MRRLVVFLLNLSVASCTIDPLPPRAEDAAGGSGCPGCVVFEDGKAQGAMTGYGWVALGTLDIIMDPTCDTDRHAITNASACTTTMNWSTSDGLCISGSIPALPASPVQSDYDNNWGIGVGVNAREPNGAMNGSNFDRVTLTLSGAPTRGLRALIHRHGDPDISPYGPHGGSVPLYCANITAGTPTTLTAFNTKCWDGSGTTLANGDIATIDKIGVMASSTSSAVNVSNLCLTKIEFQ